MIAETIINQYKSIPTTAISDATDGLNNLHSSIKPLKDSYKISGRALTVKMPVGNNLSVLKAIYEAKPGDVIVIDAKGDTYRAIAGDLFWDWLRPWKSAALLLTESSGILKPAKLWTSLFSAKELRWPPAARLE